MTQTPTVLLTHAYFLVEDAHEREVMMPYPPLGILYLSSYLQQRGVPVEVYDSTFSTFDELRRRLTEQPPSILGIYGNLMTRQRILDLIRIGREAGSLIVLGGPEPEPNAAQYLAAGAHLVVDGEGEEPLGALVELELHADRPLPFESLREIDGLIFLGPDGEVERTAKARPGPVDGRPWPDRDAIDIDRYLDTWRTHHGSSSLSLITARGCPFTCRWCSHSVYGRTHRRRSVEDVADEVEMLVDRWAPDQLWYADDVFTIHRRWTLEYADELERRGLKVPFECISRPDCLDEARVDALVRMGCRRLWLGAESGSQRILDAMARRTDVEDVIEKSHMLQQGGIEVGMFIMLGYDGERTEDLEASVELLKRADPGVFLTTVTYPIRGTEYWDDVSELVEADRPWSDRTDRDIRIRGRHSARYYRHVTRWMVNDVRAHQLVSNPHGITPADRLRWAVHRAKALVSRCGMRWTQAEREGGGRPAGRGWAENEANTRLELG